MWSKEGKIGLRCVTLSTFSALTQLTVTCSKSTVETLEKDVKYVKSSQ